MKNPDPLRRPVSKEYAARICESPIEAAFLTAFSKICVEEAFRRTRGWTEPEDDPPIIIHPQAIVGRYRCDSLISQGTTELVVECDGHDFHERTPDQAQRDRARDRLLQDEGFAVFRFTGAEIHASPQACARQAFDYLDKRAVPVGGQKLRPFRSRHA